MLVCSHCDSIIWFVRGEDTQRLWPRPPSRDTYAYDILHNGAEENSGEVQANAWFDHPIADRYYLHEHSLRGYADHVLTLLWWKCEKMLIDVDELKSEKMLVGPIAGAIVMNDTARTDVSLKTRDLPLDS